MSRPPLYCPENPSNAQKEFLDAEQIEVLFSGGAGGGKSSALLMAALQYVDHPSYGAIILRRHYRDLFLPGAIGDRFDMWMEKHDEIDIKRDGQTYVATFPSGARVELGCLDGPEDYLRYKFIGFHFIGIDQIEEIRERDYRYMLSRLHYLPCDPMFPIPIRMRATTSLNWIGQRFFEGPGDNRIFCR